MGKPSRYSGFAFKNGLDDKNISTLHWQEWEHKLLGSPEEIKEALKVLKLHPKDTKEPEKITLDKREQEALNFVEKANEGFKIILGRSFY